VNKYGDIHNTVRSLRASGLTYREINEKIGISIPKSSLTYICRGIVLSHKQQVRITKIVKSNRNMGQQMAVLANRKIFEAKLLGYRRSNQDLRPLLGNKRVKLIALAMLYLGEGTKWKGHRGLVLGSSDPNIIRLYIDLLRECYDIPTSLLKCKIQYRADQNSEELTRFWSSITGVSVQSFYPGYIDKRTIGKPTKKINYKGVCSVICAGTHIQLELEQVAVIISEALKGL
jgi:hypothetical protein